MLNLRTWTLKIDKGTERKTKCKYRRRIKRMAWYALKETRKISKGRVIKICQYSRIFAGDGATETKDKLNRYWQIKSSIINRFFEV